MFYNSANVFLRYICISAPWQVKLDKMGSEMSLKHLFSQQILLFWTQCSRMCAPGTIRRWPWGVPSCGRTRRASRTSDGIVMANSSVCQCQIWRKPRSWNSNWNPQTTAPMNAESAIVLEHQRALSMSLVSEQAWDIALLSSVERIHKLYIFRLRFIFDMDKVRSFVSFIRSFSLTPQYNPIMLSSTLTHQIQSVSWKETTILTPCSGRRKTPRQQTVS